MKTFVHHSVLTGLAAAGITLATTTTPAATLDDIQFWAGSGANQAALVIDWKDGKTEESLLWGYRWDGVASGMDMLQAVVMADPRLYAHLGLYVWGTAVLGIGYDLNENGVFGVSPTVTFDAGGLRLDPAPVPDDLRAPTEAGDHYLEGWNNGFWNYTFKSAASDAWDNPGLGASDRVLSDGAWDSYGFAAGFASSDPTEPVPVTPVPEPGTATLVILGGVFLACARRQQS